MSKKAGGGAAQILLFPNGEGDSAGAGAQAPRTMARPAAPQVQTSREKVDWPPTGHGSVLRAVLSGTFRRDPKALRETHEELRDLGAEILSPREIDIVSEREGFVFMRGEESLSPQSIEDHHLDAIKQADFVWLHAPEGYVGLSASLEVGFAHAIAVPVFSTIRPSDPILGNFVQVVDAPGQVKDILRSHSIASLPAASMTSFQRYYRRAAAERGYERESAKDCLVLMLEEFGELARAIRKRSNLARHGARGEASNEAAELADVLLYVAHMANILDIDLGSAVYEKEKLNLERFLRG